MITVTLPLYLLLIANAALIVAAAFAVLRVERALRESAEFWTSPTGAAIRTGQPSGSDPLGRQLEKRIALLQRSVDALANSTPPQVRERVVEMPMDHAVRMARRGASVDDLTRSCGLNAGEAELLHRLHGGATRRVRDGSPAARRATA